MPNYPSNITRQQFEVIRPELENFHQRTKPRQVDLYDVFCAILYILKNGKRFILTFACGPSSRLQRSRHYWTKF